MKLPKILYTISKALKSIDAKAIIVGGSVRDYFLNIPIKDYDIEVYGLKSMAVLEKVLLDYGSVNFVGKSFGILKFTHEGEEYDFSFPRTEQKIAKGHRGFEVSLDGSLDFKTAAKRRDFTINALGYDIEKNKFLDPLYGLKDIQNKRLRHIDDSTFTEDPLRVYRVIQFSARFGFCLSGETLRLCRKMVKKGLLDQLPKERVHEEWKKLLLKSEKPSQGFELMKNLDIVETYFPELHALIGVSQSPKWHPEGDVWTHTMMTLDTMAILLRGRNFINTSKKEKLKYMFVMLCHDLGKGISTTVDEEGNIRSIGHETAGLTLTKTLILRLTDEHNFIDDVLPFVEHHLKPSQFYRAKSKDKAIRKLATKVNIKELVLVAKADFLGRTTKEALIGEYKAGEWLLKKAATLKVKTKPLDYLVQGRDLIHVGLEPSPRFKEIIDEVYTLQIDGTLNSKEEALVYLEKKYGCL